MDSFLIERITQALQNRSKQIRADWDYIPAAVLVPLFYKAGIPHLLLTKRSAKLRDHKGEVAFPGGRTDPEDGSPQVTALREAEEEIGLQRDDVHLLGEMDPLMTSTGYFVTPVIGMIPHPYEFQLSSHEIEYLIEVPVPQIARPEALEIREFWFLGKARDVYFYHHSEKDPIWGVSGRIVHQFLSLVYPALQEMRPE
ncbi:MAG: CoA pyrophosphatase [Blastocatellia bacterium]|nr:CoA pyrophosphatase [Blastocatellia bacterium]